MTRRNISGSSAKSNGIELSLAEASARASYRSASARKRLHAEEASVLGEQGPRGAEIRGRLNDNQDPRNGSCNGGEGA